MKPITFHRNYRFQPNFSYYFNRSIYSIICFGILIFENVQKVAQASPLVSKQLALRSDLGLPIN